MEKKVKFLTRKTEKIVITRTNTHEQWVTKLPGKENLFWYIKTTKKVLIFWVKNLFATTTPHKHHLIVVIFISHFTWRLITPINFSQLNHWREWKRWWRKFHRYSPNFTRFFQYEDYVLIIYLKSLFDIEPFFRNRIRKVPPPYEFQYE